MLVMVITSYIFTFSDKKLLSSEGRRSNYGGEQFYQYAKGIGESVQSGYDPSKMKDYLQNYGFAFYNYTDKALSGHMTPAQKQKRYLSSHPFIRQSEVFHSALVAPESPQSHI